MDLAALGWTAFFAEAFQSFGDRGLIPARVIIEFNRFLRVATADDERTVVTAGSLFHRAAGRAELPAVGDWVALRPRGHGGIIHAVLPRKSRFLRRTAGRVVEEQIVAANVDTVFLVSGLDDELNPRRIERYLIMARESGAQPVVVLNKSDLADDIHEVLVEVESIAGGAPVRVISAQFNDGLDALNQYLVFGRTVGIIGSSGVGKTTLINQLLGEERFETQPVRENDSKGRHTTTNRQLVSLPRGGLLIDTPGMRELQLWEADEAMDESFSDVEELESQCRFPNCRHDGEPGCAVVAAIDDGRLDPDRLENYRKINAELDRLAEQKSAQVGLEAKRRVKVAIRAFERSQPNR
ncbi:MAG: ribosome small subunit-dependent GTPase A [Chloroflexi bacterium]|nr:ribosome small subunit-dependent GTPase A [Chloroflexota bacterium]